MSQTLIVTLALAAIAVTAYLIGSINFAIIFTWAYKKSDIRDSGSGNAGMTNVARTAGKLPAVLTFIFDLSKGLVSVLIGYLIITNLSAFGYDGVIDKVYGKYLAGFCCFLGHIYPIYYGFRGGKGVVTLLSVFLPCNGRVTAVCLGIFIIMFLITRIVSISSVTAAFFVPITTAFLHTDYTAGAQFIIPQYPFEIIVATLFSVIIILKHIPNIKRLIKGEEKRISFKKSKTSD